MKHYKLPLTLFILLFGQQHLANAMTNHDGYFYVSALGGVGIINSGTLNKTTAQTLADKALAGNTSLSDFSTDTGGFGNFAWSVAAGYLFASHSFLQLGIETGFVHFKDSQYGITAARTITPDTQQTIGISVSQYGVDLLGVATAHLASFMDIFVKAGGTLIKQQIGTPWAGIIDGSGSRTQLLPTIATGISINITEQMSAVLVGRYTFGRDDMINRLTTSGELQTANKVASNGALLAGISYKLG